MLYRGRANLGPKMMSEKEITFCRHDRVYTLLLEVYVCNMHIIAEEVANIVSRESFGVTQFINQRVQINYLRRSEEISV